MVRHMEKPQQQLSLIERADEVWRLDDRTREVGRRGLELELAPGDLLAETGGRAQRLTSRS